MSVNKAILLGNLGKDPELRYTSGGKAVATFSLATSERWSAADGQKQESTTWHNIVVWGKLAEVMKEYLSKGQQVFIEGRIANRSYDDKEGVKKYISEVVVTNFSFVGNKGDNKGSGASGGSGGYSQATPSDMPSGPPAGGGSDDDLPF